MDLTGEVIPFSGTISKQQQMGRFRPKMDNTRVCPCRAFGVLTCPMPGSTYNGLLFWFISRGYQSGADTAKVQLKNASSK